MRLLALMRCEWRLAWRDPHALGVLFVMPALFVLIMAHAMSGVIRTDLPPLQLAVEVPVSSPASEFFLAAVQAQLPDSSLQAAASDVDARIRLPDSFDERLLETPHQGPTLSFAAASDTLQRARIRNAVILALAQTRLAAFLLDSGLLDEREPLSSRLQHVQEQTESQLPEYQILSSGSLAASANAGQLSVPAWLIFGMFFIVLPMSSRLQQEFQSGILLRLRVIRLAPLLLLVGKLLPYSLLNLIQFAALLALGCFILPLTGLPALELHGSWQAYVLLAMCITLASCSFGVLISALARSSEQALLLSAGSNLMLAAIGGIMVPKSVMPAVMQQLAELSPMGWSLDAFLTLLVGQGSVADILPACGSLLLFALVCALTGTFLLRHRLRNTLWTSQN